MEADIKKLNFDESDYPPLLRNAVNPPKNIFVRGGFSVFKKPIVAIVGTRKATQEGIKFARETAEDFVRIGFAVVSGLAYGVDAAAHEGALQAGGLTIAVLAHGLNMTYPKNHENLAREMVAKGGAVVSEYEADTPPYQNQFLDRNRIIAGLSLATLVIEAPIHSGALATARYAAEAGREVFVLPGPYYSKNYEGSHELIRKGARLITSFQNLKEDLAAITDLYPDIVFNDEVRETADELNDDEKIVLEAIDKLSGEARVDTLIEMIKLEPQELSRVITNLILNDKIIETANGLTIRR